MADGVWLMVAVAAIGIVLELGPNAISDRP